MAQLADDVRGFLSEGTRTGKLGWVALDGRPLVAPIWFVVEDDDLLFNTGADTAKGRAIARDSRVVITVDRQRMPYGYVQVQGVAEVITDLAEVRRIATLCGGRYMGAERAEEFGARNGVPGELGVRLRPTKVVADLDVSVTPISYDDGLRSRIVGNLAAHERRIVADDGRRRAAVAVGAVDSAVGEDRVDPRPPTEDEREWSGLVNHGLDGRMETVSGGAAFLLCRRAPRLNSHASQWALPGGRIDDGETVIEAARREVDEELGVALGDETVLGLLDDYPTRSGYVMTPVVLWGGGRLDLRPSAAEVAAAYRIGLHHLARPDSPRFISIPESDRPVVQVPLGSDLIHAPTGAVLVQFRWLGLEGNTEPVDHFEQPVFAWK